RGVGIFEWLIFEEEYYRVRAPTRVSQNGIFLLAPTMFEFGTEAQKARYLPAMASGDEIWCQGWSEPDAGSDLAGIRSRASRTDGPTWILNGQKTWASRGAFADWCFGIFRTDPDAERHRGLTYVLVAMDTPGVTVRPIPQIDGETGFAEIFFDYVEVPEDQILGEVDHGWSVAMATAGSERGLSLRSPARYTEAADRLLRLYASRGGPGASTDAVALAHMHAEAYKLHTYWTASRVVQGHAVGAEASCNKIFWSETDVAIHTTALDLLGPDAELLQSGAPGDWLDGYLFSLAGPIYAGTNEIQRNVVAERLLGRPR
ncbi:MAG TPA: acyl-CoA dehydrogenase family protein, partial [Acidimicrobiales bacterium]|nr:acyl-CoA dehydrogenase family protein [Acidimicrobiales bacterium]